ncbi:MAG: ATP synthase F1 subunit epsilon [Candidatus Levybacteria bacterium]|nr:ATP synthase F1 subunit epsilon [Candidatus Levybacteria bacterium]
MKLNLEIITPEKVIYKDEVNEVICPTTKGQIAVLPGHVGLVGQIAAGELIVKKEGKQYFMAITGGFLEVSSNNISILADYAIRSEDIEVAKVEEARKRAERVMQEKVSEEDFAIAQGELRKSLLQLKIVQRRRTHHTPPIK